VKTESNSAVCSVCDDTGWKPTTDGRVTKCDCRLRQRGATIEEAAHVPRRYAKCSFETFSTDLADLSPTEHQSLHSARFRAGRFVEEYPNDKMGLLLIGPTGTGKTHLAVSAIRLLMDMKGVACLFVDYRELLREMRQSYNPQVQATELDVLRPVLETEVVLIDDLGSSTASAWERDAVAYILNKRYSDERTTIITTYLLDRPSPIAEPIAENPSPNFGRSRDRKEADSALRDRTLGERIGDQMRARLHEMCRTIEIQAKDFRERPKS
jgi:DNA replication protein DnaC